MTESNTKRPVWKRILRAALIVLLLLAMGLGLLVFSVAGVPRLKSHATERRMTRYVLAHSEEMTEYAVRLHDEVQPNTFVEEPKWEALWYPVEGSEAYVVQLICRSWGMVTSTGYEGVYYSSDGKAFDFSWSGVTLDHAESKAIGSGWYWYKVIT